MAAAKASKQHAPRRHRPPAEKHRLVELTLRAGASVSAIAQEHDVHPNSLYRWQALYRAGKLEMSAPDMGPVASSATFVPVNIVPAMRRPQPATRPDAEVCGSGVVQLAFASSGVTLRIETGAVDAALVCALVAE